VLDDGVGMTAAQARMALVRHATSKLRALEDLASLLTMGFRGEALPAIAAVSRLVLTTRPRAAREQPATRLRVEAGRVTAEEEAAGPPGTIVEVRDLLYNTPARLKFMKGDATESAHIGETVARLAMANPAVHFRLVSRGRTALDAPPHGDGHERVQAVLGSRLAGSLHRSARQDGAIAIELLLGAPELAQTTTRSMHLYVGRRWVRDRGLVHAVLQGYGELVPRGRYPAAVLFLDIEGPDVDVNVHPQKLEVRFADAPLVYAAVRRAVRDAVASAPWLGAAAPPSFAPAPAGRASEMAREYATGLSRSLFSWRRPEAPAPPTTWPAPSRSASPSASANPTLIANPGPSPNPGLTPNPGPNPNQGLGPNPGPNPSPNSHSSPNPNPSRPGDSASLLGTLRYLGQLDRTYLLCEGEGELVLIDQHAAHERVAFERLRERQRSRSLPRQQLLFPQTVGLDRAQAAVARESRDALESIGFDIEPFGDAPGGGCAFAVKSVPAELRRTEDPVALLVQIVDELAALGGTRALDERLDSVLATLACHSVVRAGDEMAPAEVEALLAQLAATANRAHCPHGRPVMLRMAVDEIARRFGRI
jgi:DNA mismatch repair protein MutL